MKSKIGLQLPDPDPQDPFRHSWEGAEKVTREMISKELDDTMALCQASLDQEIDRLLKLNTKHFPKPEPIPQQTWSHVQVAVPITIDVGSGAKAAGLTRKAYVELLKRILG